jgi:hypothetical protein
MQPISNIRSIVRIYEKGQEPDDVLYWLNRPPLTASGL